MRAEIEGFDDTDMKTLQCHLTGKKMKERLADVSALLARLGVITGIEIPANPKVFQLLVTEIQNTIFNENRYGDLTFEEYVQAFNMVANNDFGDMKDWGKLMNMKYFRQMMNAYLSYKGTLLNKYFDWEMITGERMKIEYKNDGKHKIDFKPITERCYQDYLKGDYNPFLWSWQCFDDLVDAGWVPAEAYKSFETKAKQKLIGDLNHDIMRTEKRIDKQSMYHEDNKKRYGAVWQDNMPAKLGNHIKTTTELSMIHNGQSAELIAARAKQLCMEDYFKQQAIKGTEKLFEPISGI